MNRNKEGVSNRGIAKIGDVLPQLMVRYGLHRRRNLDLLEETWRRAVGEQYATVTHLSGLSRGTLTVKVTHNMFIQELSFRLTELLTTLNSVPDGETIKRIKFIVG